jgi:hypothetical protein
MTEPLHDPRTRASTVLEAWNGEAVDAGAVPVHAVGRFREIVLAALAGGGRLATLFGRPAEGQSS